MDIEVAQLKETIERLQRELAETTQEKIQAAEYGLAVLNEKQRLQAHVEGLEAQIEASRSELELTRTAVEKFNRIVKCQTQVGVEEDERRAMETAQRESDYSQQILDLEFELRSAKHQLDDTRNENIQLATQNGELREGIDRVERDRVELKRELREVRSRESRLATEYSELEEENVQLQKQVAHSRASQLELEAARHGVVCLEGELVTLTAQLEETVRLKSIIERQLEETIVLLQTEREHKYALKRELDSVRVNSMPPSTLLTNTQLNTSVSLSMLNAAALISASTPTPNCKTNDTSFVPKSCQQSEASRALEDVESAYFGSVSNENTHANVNEAGSDAETESRCDAVSEMGNDERERDVDSDTDTKSTCSYIRSTSARKGQHAQKEQSSLSAEMQLSELRSTKEVLAASESEKQELLARLADRERQLDTVKRDALAKQQQLDRLNVYCHAISSLNEIAALQDDADSQSALVKSISGINLLSQSASNWNLSASYSVGESASTSTGTVAPNQSERGDSQTTDRDRTASSSEPGGSASNSRERETAADCKDSSSASAPVARDRLLRQYEVRYGAALKQIASLTFELRRAEDRLAVERSGKSDSQLRDELVELQTQLGTLERDVRERDSVLRSRTERAVALRRTASHFASRYFDLIIEIASLANSQQTPSALRGQDAIERLRIERERIERSALFAADLGDVAAGTPCESEDETGRTLELELVGLLRRRVELLSPDNRQSAERKLESESERAAPNRDEDVDADIRLGVLVSASASASESELREQINRMRDALLAKREQIGTLRTLLKTNKTSAEQAVGGLRDKYEMERAAIGETVRRLRDEMRTLKEEAAQFASLRCMLTQRCDEYVAQLDEARMLLRAADEERRTLGCSLKLALSQKMSLAQRVDTLERARERRPRRPPRHAPPAPPEVAASPAHDRRPAAGGRYSGRSIAVYAGQNTNTHSQMGATPSIPIPIPTGYANAATAAQPHSYSYGQVPPFVAAAAAAASFNPCSSQFNAAAAVAEPVGMYASQPPAPAPVPYQPAAAHGFDLANSTAQAHSFDAAAYLQLMQQALAPFNTHVQHPTRTYGAPQSRPVSGVMDNQVIPGSPAPGAGLYHVVAPTAVYASTAQICNSMQPPSPGRFTASPSHATNSGSPSPFAGMSVNGMLPNGIERVYNPRP